MGIVVDHKDRARGLPHSAWSGNVVMGENVIRFYEKGRDYRAAYIRVSELDQFVAALRDASEGEDLVTRSAGVGTKRGDFSSCILCEYPILPFLHKRVSIKVMRGAIAARGHPTQTYHKKCMGKLADRLDEYVDSHTGDILCEML